MSDDAAAIKRFADELQQLYEAAGRPQLATLIREGRAQDPAVNLNDASVSDWLRGKSVPSSPAAVRFLVRYLEPLAARHAEYSPRGAEWWLGLRRRAWEQAHVRRGGKFRHNSKSDDTPTRVDQWSEDKLRALRESTGYECSLLSMIVAKAIADFPVSTMSREKLLHGRVALDLYRAVEVFISRYQDLCEEVIDILAGSKIEQNLYGSAYHVSGLRFTRANRKLLDVANGMRDISRSLGGILSPESALRQRFSGVLMICMQISVAEDFLLIQLGTPPQVPRLPLGYEEAMSARLSLMHTSDLTILDNTHGRVFLTELGGQMVHDFEKLLGELDAYKIELRDAIASTQDRRS